MITIRFKTLAKPCLCRKDSCKQDQAQTTMTRGGCIKRKEPEAERLQQDSTGDHHHERGGTATPYRREPLLLVSRTTKQTTLLYNTHLKSPADQKLVNYPLRYNR